MGVIVSLTLNIDESQLDQVATLILGTGQRAKNLKPVNKEALNVVMADVDQRFVSAPGLKVSGTVHGGAKWPELTEKYLEYRSVFRETKSGTLQPRIAGQQLRDTGELLQSFQVGKADNISENNADGWTFGSSLPKARGLRHKRPLLFFHDELADVLLTLYTAYILGESKL